ncbi:MAG: enoyl-CoA hydratase-related protein [Pseudomonadota bacterium]
MLTSVDRRGIATLTLNRPEVHNAYDGDLIDGLIDAVASLAADHRVRLLILRGNGKHFQAGADLAWLKKVAGFDLADNLAFSRQTTEAMRGLNAFPHPTIALVHGACFGGGIGMVACCDVRIATRSASFGLTEVRWGVIPAPIMPQLCAAMGIASLRRYGITGERFDAEEARRIGLLHEVCAEEGLDAAAAPIIEAILKGAPDAIRQSKQLVLSYAGLDLSDQDVEALAAQGAAKRASAEAAEGLSSFEQRRDPAWYQTARPPKSRKKSGKKR